MTPLEQFELDRARRAEFWAPSLPGEALIDGASVAAVVGQKPQTLEVKRIAGGGIPFVKINRRVYYRKGDVLAWLEANSRFAASTAAAIAPVREAKTGVGA